MAELTDTVPEMKAFQIKLLREATIAQRFARVRSLTQTTFYLSRRAIEKNNPELNEDELNVLFVSHYYGKELADGLRDFLKQRNHESS